MKSSGFPESGRLSPCSQKPNTGPYPKSSESSSQLFTFYLPNIKLNIILPPKRAVIAQSVWRWATGWTIGVLGFDSRRGLGIFLSTTASRTALEPTQPPIQWVPGALSLGVKRPEREADNSPPSSAEVKSTWSYTSTPPIRLHGVVLS
jgi:hypothetical protein